MDVTPADILFFKQAIVWLIIVVAVSCIVICVLITRSVEKIICHLNSRPMLAPEPQAVAVVAQEDDVAIAIAIAAAHNR